MFNLAISADRDTAHALVMGVARVKTCADWVQEMAVLGNGVAKMITAKPDLPQYESNILIFIFLTIQYAREIKRTYSHDNMVVC